MRIQVVYKPRSFSYDQDWLDAFAGHELVSEETTLDADLIVILHSMSGQWAGYPSWLVRACQNRKGKLVIFHTNEFKDIKARELAATNMGADFIATQLPDGRLYTLPTISMPHALNPRVFKDWGIKRPVSVGFRGALYKPGINDERNRVITAFMDQQDSDIVLDKNQLMPREQWAAFLNTCKATVGAEAGNEGARIISPRHLEAVGCGTLQVLLPGEYCGVLSPEHYLPFTTVPEALEVIRDDKQRTEITERALEHVMAHHTYHHRIEHLMESVWTPHKPSSTH